MATVVVMPQLGNSVESCLIISWSVAEGDEIAENAVLCEVETDKASMEVPSSASGTILKLLWSQGDDVPVKEPLVVVGAPGEDPGPVLADIGWGGDAAAEAAEAAPAAQAAAAVPTAPAAATRPATGVSPRARQLAASKGLDAGSIEAGSGPGGRVIERDVQAALAAGPDVTRAAARAGGAGQSGLAGTGLGGRATAADLQEGAPAPVSAAYLDFPGPVTQAPLKGIRKTIADRMMNSLASSAQLTYTTTARAQGLLGLRKKLKGSDPELGLAGVTIGDLVGFAAVKTAARHANHNAHLADGVLTTFERVHLGFATDTPRGLLVPTVRNASSMSLKQFSAISKQLAQEAIAGAINPDLLGGATFTVSNLGGFGIESFTPLLNVPQTAILGVDAIFPRATIDADGSTGVEQRIGFSLTADHRVIDGADAARFLQDLVRLVENIEITVLG
ncbi:MAG: dihydrolipoamide acetyltransferase family protein [Arachnia sp.]